MLPKTTEAISSFVKLTFNLQQTEKRLTKIFLTEKNIDQNKKKECYYVCGVILVTLNNLDVHKKSVNNLNKEK